MAAGSWRWCCSSGSPCSSAAPSSSPRTSWPMSQRCSSVRTRPLAPHMTSSFPPTQGLLVKSFHNFFDSLAVDQRGKASLRQLEIATRRFSPTLAFTLLTTSLTWWVLSSHFLSVLANLISGLVDGDRGAVLQDVQAECEGWQVVLLGGGAHVHVHHPRMRRHGRGHQHHLPGQPVQPGQEGGLCRHRVQLGEYIVYCGDIFVL